MKEFLENKKQLFQVKGERIENLKRKMKNSNRFETYTYLYVKLVEEVSTFSKSHAILIDEIAQM